MLYCVDVDECAEKLDRCDQECVNTVGAYRCACRSGYRRIARHKCAGTGIQLY